MTPESVGAVIVHFHRECEAAELVAALIGREGVPADHVVVADNGSSPGLLAREFAARECSPVVLDLDNDGFAAAMNAGVRALPERARILILLSHEVRLESGAVEALVDAVEGDSRTVAGPLLLLDEETVWSAGGLLSPVRLIPRHRHGNAPLATLERGPSTTDWLDGSVLATSRRFLDELGGLDERFFLYGEDIDLALRAREAGGVVRVVSAARAFQAPSPEIDSFLWTRNPLLLYRAHGRRLAALLWVLSCLIGMARDVVLRRPHARLARRRAALREGLRGVGGPPPSPR